MVCRMTHVIQQNIGRHSHEWNYDHRKQNYPNLFNPTTVISYRLSAASQVTLKVYDALGRKVAALVNAARKIGSYSPSFDANRLTCGIYFCRLKAGYFVSTRKMLLLK